MSEQYITITATFIKATSKAILIQGEDDPCWIARSCLAWKSDKEVYNWDEGEEVEITLFEWVARKESFI